MGVIRDKRWGLGMRISVALFVALLLASPAPVHTKALGRGSDPMLARFDAALDSEGIDIVPGLARDLDFKTEHRPRLAKLAGFPLPQPSQNSPDSNEWMRQFKRGAFDYITAYRPAENAAGLTGEPSSSDEFLSEWSRAPAAERVFIAFTRDDAATARKVAQVLRAQGFVVFTYLRSEDEAPWAKPEVVGRLFREAGHHFVIDTLNARRSGGVAFEALVLARLKEVTTRAEPDRKVPCLELFK
jgi:hypothetical protein